MENTFLKASAARVVKILTGERDINAYDIESHEYPSDRFIGFPRKAICTSQSITTTIGGAAMGSLDANDEDAVEKCVRANDGAVLCICDVMVDTVAKLKLCYNDVLAVEIVFELVKFEDSDEYNCMMADARIIYETSRRSHKSRISNVFEQTIATECAVSVKVKNSSHDVVASIADSVPTCHWYMFPVDLDLPIEPFAVHKFSDLDANVQNMMGSIEERFFTSIHDALQKLISVIKHATENVINDRQPRVFLCVEQNKGASSLACFGVYVVVGTVKKKA